ncbi:hypothetical protein HOLleu_45025 [Holothuria leucospilota]|uniref:Uncharacterized protein n=1 Tax=Holothuria leucospilota TaxID=206669 RepID=A0A9Q0Y8F6_HOLLE|nr:hypothetical protein HOLleu_45025 [Holothuria leucospilota]
MRFMRQLEGLKNEEEMEDDVTDDGARDENYDADENMWDNVDEQEVKERALMLVCDSRGQTTRHTRPPHPTWMQFNVIPRMPDVSQLFDDIVGSLKENTKAFLHSQKIDTQSDAALQLFEKFDIYQKPFCGIETDYKQPQYLLASRKFVPPLEKEITVGYAQRTDPTTGDASQVPTPRVFHYVPIIDVIKLIVEDHGFWECVQEHTKSTDGIIRDFHDALYKSSDVAEFGFDVVLQPLVDELKELESTGLEVNCPSFQGNLKVGLAQVVGDNLGIYSLFGFTQSFTANFVCRKCKVHRDVMRRQTKSNDPLLRTVENYSEDHLADNLPQTGVRTSCLLNELESFHVVMNHAPDIMHDMLEGVCSLELKLVLQNLIDNGSFDLDTLNACITTYNYGFPDGSNKPCVYSRTPLINADGSSGQNAAQMWTLMRHIGLIIGDLVPEGNEYWELLLTLCECMDIIFAPSLTLGDIVFMQEIISDHHELYLELFPERHLKPKHHFMLHYPEAAHQIGPLVNYWAMRYEAKHNFFRRLSHIVCNFKNITKTMAPRHQMYLCYQPLSKQSFKEASFEIGPGSCTLLRSLPDCHVLSNLLKTYPLYGDVFVAKWVTVYGTKYRKGMMVAFDRNDDQYPVYGEIRDILIVRGLVHLVLEKWKLSTS